MAGVKEQKKNEKKQQPQALQRLLKSYARFFVVGVF